MPKKYLYLLITFLIIVSATTLVVWHNSKPSNLNSTHIKQSNPKDTGSTGTKISKSFNKQQYSLTDPTSIWVIVNKQHPLQPIDYATNDLQTVGNGQFMRAEAANALEKLFSAATAAGYTLDADSAYRSYVTQQSVYASEVKAYGKTIADSESARPGYSEHQTGWAVDIGTAGCHVQDCFGTTAAGKWVLANSYAYGFIQRYPGSLTSITGYRDETWHFRYIGVPLSNELHSERVATLEQFFGITGGISY